MGQPPSLSEVSSVTLCQCRGFARVTQHRRLIGTDFVQLSGDDPTALGYNATGGVGAISVTSNVAPELCAQFQAATLASW